MPGEAPGDRADEHTSRADYLEALAAGEVDRNEDSDRNSS